MLKIFYQDTKTKAMGCDTNSMAFSETSIKTWQDNYPDRELLYVFDAASDLFSEMQKNKIMYQAWCNQHGLISPDTFGVRFTSPEGNIMEITGYNPKSPKYPILLMNLTKNRLEKCSIQCIQAFVKN